MDEPKKALLRLKQTLQRPKKKNKQTAQCIQAIEHVESHLILLKSSILTPQLSEKLSDCLRLPLLPIYAEYPPLTLEFTAALSKFLYSDKILPEYAAGNDNQRSRYETVLNFLLSGVLDFLDDHDDTTTKDAIGTSLYPVLCSFSFSLSMPAMSAQLRFTVYTLLAESASAHKANQDRLRDVTVVGGSKLGMQIWRTKDFLVLESLLNLFARMMPSTNNTLAGRSSRLAFIRSVFGSSPENQATGEVLVKMLEHISTRDWEPTAVKILETLASSNIAFPQPFAITEVIASGQTKPSDRLYVDDKGFCANVVIEEDVYESLEVPYAITVKIELLFHSVGGKELPKPMVVIHTKGPPLVGAKPMSQTEQVQDHSLSFSVERDMVPRFQEALHSRGLGKRLRVERPRKQSVSASAAILEIDSAGGLLGKDERYENLSQFYGTNEPSDDTVPTPDAKASILVPLETPRSVSPARTARTSHNISVAPPMRKNLISSDTKTYKGKGPQAKTCSPEISDYRARSPSGHSLTGKPANVSGDVIKSLRRTFLQELRDAAFGTSDEELSEIEHTPEPDPGPTRSTTKVASESINLKKTVRLISTKIILDSDDDANEPNRVTVNRTAKRTAIRKNTMLSDDDIEDSFPLASKIAPLTRRLSLAAAPKASLKRVVSVLSSVSIDIPASAVARPTEVTHMLAELPRTSPPAAVVADSLPDPNVNNLPATPIRSTTPVLRNSPGFRQKKAVVYFKGDRQPNIEEIAFSCSSPVPQPKLVKARLRKKDGTSAMITKSNTASHIATSKRKRKQADEDDQDLDAQLRKPPSKKSRTEPQCDTDVEGAVPPERTESQILRPRNTAVLRATKRYGGKKLRTSSPVVPSHDVDYDAIPNDSPSATSPEEKSSKPEPRARSKIPEKKKVAKSQKKPQPKPKAHLPLPAKLTVAVNEDRASTLTKTLPRTRSSTKAITMKSETHIADGDNESVVLAYDEVTHPINDLTVYGSIEEADHDTSERAEHSTAQSHQNTSSAKKPGQPHDAAKSHAAFVGSIADMTDNQLPARPLTDVTSDPQEAHDATLVGVEAPVEEPPFPASNYHSIEDNAVQLEGEYSTDVTNTEFTTDPSKRNSLSVPPPPEEKVVKVEKPTLATVPAKSGTVESEDDITMIDLTLDEPLLKPLRDLYDLRNPASVLDSPTRGILKARPQPALSVGEMAQAPMSNHGKPSVTFSAVPDGRENTNGALKSTMVTKVVSARSYGKSDKKSLMLEAGNGDPSCRKPPPGIEELADVLDRLGDTILRKISGKVDGVRNEVKVSCDRLLLDAIGDLEKMRAQSVERFNMLIGLEAEYATFGRSLTHVFHDLIKVGVSTNEDLKRMLELHDRTILGNKVPKSLFSGNLPQSIVKGKAR
ncbi:unnamed protein product [Somion occarium]|uniref:Uncharacterized protein n=1 Tax=Somion occarium TaxID=3059160 RepID=A0ABP1D7D3_9APHY